MRSGSQGPTVWPECLRYGVAAIGYSPFDTVDLSGVSRGEPRDLWEKLAPSQKSSLAHVAYDMANGDVIYVKDGNFIICRGTVTGPYQFDPENHIVGARGDDDLWPHHIPVDWEHDFVPVGITLGAEQTTVLCLRGDRLRRLEVAVRKANKGGAPAKKSSAEAVLEAVEGRTCSAEARFRSRNPALIDAKKMESDGKCNICGFSFTERYPGLARDCLVAHHTKPIGGRKRASKTTLDDIDLLCPNCHAAVHTVVPPLTAGELRRRLPS